MLKKIFFVFLIFILIILFVFIFQKKSIKDNIRIYSISGKLVDFGDGFLKLSYKNPIPNKENEEKEILFSLDNTVFAYRYSDELKDEEQYNVELIEYKNNLDKLELRKDFLRYEAPSRYKMVNVDLNDLKIGENVLVFYDKNLSINKIFIKNKEKGFSLNVVDEMQKENENLMQGIVVKINESEIEVQQKDSDPMLVNDLSIKKKFLFNSKTKIVKKEIKSLEQIEEEQKIYHSKNQELKASNINFPNKYNEIEVDYSFLKVGQNVIIRSFFEHENEVVKKIDIIL